MSVTRWGAYKGWEEVGMKDSRLLKLRPPLRVEEFSRSEAEAPQYVPKYQELYSLSNHLLQLMAAWNIRVQKVGGDWEDLEQRKQFIALPKREEEGGRENNWQEIFGGRPSKALWELEVKEEFLQPDERARYSVGCLMEVLGSRGDAEMFKKEVERVRRLVQVLLMRVLSPLLPWLPDITLLIICKHLCEEEGGLDSLCLGGMEGTRVLVERKYIVSLYQTLDYLYKGVREVMFKHAMETSAPWYPVKFKSLRSRLANTTSLLETLHKIPHRARGGQTSNGVEKLFTAVTREVPVHKEVSYDFYVRGQILVMLETKRGSVVSDGHLFLPARLSKGSLKISFLNLASGELFSFPLLAAATLVDLTKESSVCLNTSPAVNGDMVAYSVTVGYPGNYASSRDIIKVFNWVKQELVWQLEVPFGMTQVWVCSTEIGSMYIAHSEIGLSRDVVRLFKQGVEGVFMEIEDIDIMDFHRGLMVYRKKEDENDSRFRLVVVMDIEGGKEVGEVRREEENEVFIQISRLPGPLTVLEYDGDTLNFYLVEKEDQVLVKQVKLHQEVRLQIGFDFRLVDDSLMHLISREYGPSSKTLSRQSTRHMLVNLSYPLQPLVNVSVVEKEEWKKENMDVIHMSADKVVFLGKNPILINFDYGESNYDVTWGELVIKTTQLDFSKSEEEIIRWDMDMASKQILDKAGEKKEVNYEDEEQG